MTNKIPARTAFSALGQYQVFSMPVYDGASRHSIYLQMDDGVKIALDYYIPIKDGVEVQLPLPVIFHHTPYNRAVYGRNLRSFPPQVKEGIDDDEIVYSEDGIEGIYDLCRYGYVLASADCRGTGASFGERVTTNSRREAADGKFMVEWLASQPFCDGNVGTFGFSYHGGTQLGLMSLCPKGLKAAFVGSTDLDKYDGWVRDGIPRAFGSEPDTVYGDTPEEIEKTICRILADTVPVDEDQDKVLLKKALYEHVGNGRQIPIMRDLNWRDSLLPATGKEHWKETGNSYYLEGINASGCAVYVVGGTYDVFRKETAAIWANLTVPKKMLVGPWYHTSPKVDVSWFIEALRWFDYHLKGIDNGIMQDAPVSFKVTSYDFSRKSHNGSGTGYWMEENEWPVGKGARGNLYLKSAGFLGVSPSAEKNAVPYQVKYGCVTNAEAVYTTKPSGPPYMPVRPGNEDKVLDTLGCVFTSKPLHSAKRVIGHPMAYITFSMDDPGYMEENYDTDIFVNLIDYNPETEEGFLVTSGQLRASMRKESDEAHYNVTGLPWHRCNKGDEEFLEIGKEYTLAIDMMPASYLFKKDHSIRITLSCSMNGTYYKGKAEYEKDPEVKTPRLSFYVGGENGSRVELPDIFMEEY